MSVGTATPKDTLKQFANDAGVRLKDVLVLSPQNDPFNCGRPAQIQQAEWFAAVWAQLMGTGRGHLRKFHYKLISLAEPVLKPDGKPYINTDPEWERLQLWSKSARYLGYVDPQNIVDNRNPKPHVFAPKPVDVEGPTWSIEEWYGFNLPKIPTSLYMDFGFQRQPLKATTTSPASNRT